MKKLDPRKSGPDRFSGAGGCSGFSLVEVSVAIGIVAFAFVALFALLPQGANTFRRTVEVNVCSQIAQKVIADMQQMDFDQLVSSSDTAVSTTGSFRWPFGTPGKTRYFDEAGNEVLVSENVALNPKMLSPQQRAKISYWVNIRVVPRALMPAGGGGARRCSDLAQLTVQVAFNPSGQALSYAQDAGAGGAGAGAGGAGNSASMANLVVPKPGISVLNYPVLISRGL
ncbi:MAG: hypothetical protein RLZZ253_2801 [Verrucomicrobiota bacterium]|jgi:uncharacterized protein (TIGR02598 family)